VNLISSKKANYKKETGMLIWSFQLGGRENKKILYKYSVDHKKDKAINMR